MLNTASIVHDGKLTLGPFLLSIIILILVSAVCSGLNVAVMSLEMGDLKRKAKLNNKYAKSVLPLRKNTHLTLASILLTNVAAVSATTLVLDQHFDGWIAGIGATLLIVIFGEILPQALFSKNPLLWSYRFAPVLKFMRFITYFISWPLSIMLDKFFPPERAKLQTRSELGLVMSEHLKDDSSELDDSEIEIMRGALGLSSKRVKNIVTDIQHTYWLTPETVLDDAKIDEIKLRGFSRMPIFNKELTKCYGVLLMKSLVDIDFEETEYHVEDMIIYPAQLVGSMTALDTLFRKFINADSHLIPVEKDDKIIGIVTIEDLIEEIFGQEIEDETDRRRKS
jgi:metal transporter CNNM